MSMKILSHSTKSLIRESIETILLISPIISVFHISLQNFRVEGSSMDPNIKEGNCVVAEKVTYWIKPELFSHYISIMPVSSNHAND